MDLGNDVDWYGGEMLGGRWCWDCGVLRWGRRGGWGWRCDVEEDVSMVWMMCGDVSEEEV